MNYFPFLMHSLFWMLLLFYYPSIYQCLLNRFDLNYYGDKEFWNFFQDLCDNDFYRKKVAILLIEHFGPSTDNEHYQHYVYQVLDECNCPFDLLTYSNETDIINRIDHNPNYEFRNVLIVIDLMSFNSLTLDEFKEFLMTIDSVYIYCGTCLPILAIFEQSIQTLNQWLSESYPILDKRFRCSLISGTLDKPNAVHLRPIVDSCHLLPGVYLPNTTFDFNRMKFSFKKCNLNSSYITIVVNDVCPLMTCYQKSKFY